MNLRTLPPSMLLALGLGCPASEEPISETTRDTCLSTGWEVTGGTSQGSATSQGPTSATSTTGRTTGTSEVDASACLDVGPCLFDIGAIPDMGRPETSTGPCLEPPLDTGMASSSGSDTGTGTGTGTGTSGSMLDEPSDARAAAVERVLSRGTLPADVAARLRTRSGAP